MASKARGSIRDYYKSAPSQRKRRGSSEIVLDCITVATSSDSDRTAAPAKSAKSLKSGSFRDTPTAAENDRRKPASEKNALELRTTKRQRLAQDNSPRKRLSKARFGIPPQSVEAPGLPSPKESSRHASSREISSGSSSASLGLCRFEQEDLRLAEPSDKLAPRADHARVNMVSRSSSPLSSLPPCETVNKPDSSVARSAQSTDLGSFGFTSGLSSVPLSDPPAGYAPDARSKQASFNTSFNSVITIPSSQLSQSSSRRIVNDGVEAVTNSSSELDPLDEVDGGSESDSLVDIDELIARKRQKLSAEGHPLQGLVTPASEDRTLRSSRRQISKAVRRSSPAPPKKTYKHNLAALVKQKQKDAELNARVCALEDSVHRAEEEARALEDSEGPGKRAGQKIVAGLDEDDDANDRLKQALKRMDALEEEITFHFFETTSDPDPMRHDLPGSSLPEQGWELMMRTPESRNHCVLTGFAADLSRATPPSAEIQEWMLGEILCETREDLAFAYVEVLAACASHEEKNQLLDIPMLRDCFDRLGAREDIVEQGARSGGQILPSKGRRQPRSGRQGLEHFLVLLTKLSDSLRPEVRQACFYFLALMLIDDNTTGNASFTKDLQDTLVRLCVDVEEEDWEDFAVSTCQKILSSVKHPVLLNNLLYSLPAYEPRISIVRRRLAIAFSLDQDLTDSGKLSHPTTWKEVNKCLTASKHFSVNEHTDYALLGARIGILDTAIGSGFSTFAFMQTRTYPGALTISTETESDFNASVDRVASALRHLSSFIRDAGAAHLRRTECKSAIERLAARLEYGVRTRPKPKKSVFGGRTLTGMEGSEGALEKFLSAQRQAVKQEG